MPTGGIRLDLHPVPFQGWAVASAWARTRGTLPPPFFILGTERSGSNLLRLILHSHSRLAIPHPPHLVRYFKPLQAGYGNLEEAPDFHRLVQDVAALLKTHIYPWDVEVDWARVEREARPRDVFGIQYALYGQYAAAKGKERWGCKSTFLIGEVPTLRQHHPDACFLWLVRDPRDVAASSRRSVFSATHPVFVAELWRDQQQLGLRWEREGIPLLRIHYEALLQAPEAEVQRICEFLGEKFEPQMLRYFETEEAQRSGGLSQSWATTARPIQKDRAGSWKKELSAQEVAWVEAIAGPTLEALGYSRTLPPSDWEPSFLERLQFSFRERVQELGIEWQSLRKDRNVGRRWRRALLLWRLQWRS